MPPDRPIVLRVTKIDVAKRQLDTAIQLWFSDGDPVSIHTLTGAARRITLDLGVNRKNHLGLFDPAHLPKGKEREYKVSLRKAETFFKHAKNDPDQTLTFPPQMTDVYLLDAIDSFQKVHGSCSFFMAAFHFRFALGQPSAVTKQLFGNLSESDRINLRELDKTSFLEAFRPLFATLPSVG